MGIRSKVALLPAAVRTEIDRLIVERAFSGYQSLAEWLQAQGYRMSLPSRVLPCLSPALLREGARVRVLPSRRHAIATVPRELLLSQPNRVCRKFCVRAIN